MDNKIIKSHAIYEEDQFLSLIGFQLVEVKERELKETEERGIEFTFKNSHHVAINLSFIDGEFFLSEPYAVKEDLSIASNEDMRP